MTTDQRPLRVRVMLALAVTAALAGCSAEHRSNAAVDSTAPAAASPAATLATINAAAAGRSFSAVYDLATAGQPAVHVSVASTPSAYRLQIAGAGSTSVFLVNPQGTYSCELTAARRRCFLVAMPGHPVPAALDPTLEKVFRGYLSELATHPGGYRLTRATPTDAAAGLPAGQCFTAGRTGPATAATVSKGTYCWAADGLLTRYVSPTGTLTLRSIGTAPTAASIVPPVAVSS